MKKLFLSIIVLFFFTISVLLFQISCKKEAKAQSPTYVLIPATTSKLGGVIPDGTTISVDANGKISAITNQNTQENKIIYVKYGAVENTDELWTANYDGSEAKKINITIPTGMAINDNHFTLSPDHKTLFLSMYPLSGTVQTSLYACNIDGSNLHKVVDGTNNKGVDIGVAY